MKKMTLKAYYRSLPEATTPRSDFINEVAKRCGVTPTSVRNWVLYGMHPRHYSQVKVLMDITGIKEEDLWTD